MTAAQARAIAAATDEQRAAIAADVAAAPPLPDVAIELLRITNFPTLRKEVP